MKQQLFIHQQHALDEKTSPATATATASNDATTTIVSKAPLVEDSSDPFYVRENSDEEGEPCVSSSPSSRLDTNTKPRCYQHRDVCDAGFGSWCDDSSTEDDDEDNSDNWNNDDDTIVVSLTALRADNNYTAFYFACRNQEDNDNHSSCSSSEDDEKDDRQRQLDEELVCDNLRRRTLRFSENPPQVKEYERAPPSCFTDLYYTGHQLQQMMDAYYNGGAAQEEEELLCA